MTLKLYNTTSPQRKIYKTLTNETVFTIRLKDNNDVCNPTVLLTYVQGIDNFNYAYIVELGRYYWIDAITEMVGGVTALHLRVDVLMTYKPSLENETLLIKRTSKGGSTMITDNSLPLYPYKALKTIRFEEVPFFKAFTEYTRCFVLNVAGKWGASPNLDE